jgi:putative ABC transport system permease protein
VCGLGLSYVGVQFFVGAALAETPSWMRFTMDGVVFAYLVTLCVGSALVCGLVPAWHASRPNLAATLNDAGRTSAGSRWRRRWTGALVVVQVAASLVLLTGAGLMMQNLTRLMRTNVGVETRGLSQMAIILRQNDDTPERRRLFLDQLDERLSTSASVNAAMASHAPLGQALVRRVRIDGQSASEPEALPLVSLIRVGQRYFDVVGASVIAGRALAADEVRQPGDSVVVNERFARMHFQDGAAVGKRILLIEQDARTIDANETQWMTIVGVVGNVRQRWLPSGDFDPVVYGSYAADPPQAIQVLARSASGPAAAAGFVGDQVRALDPDLPLLPMSTVDETLALALWPQRLFGSMFAIFASIAMLLATSGLYAVTTYAVSRRTREIGVRVALGADARGVWWAVTGATLGQLAIGLVLGTAGAAGVAAILPAILVGTGSVANVFVFAGVAVVLVAAGVAASAVPARRAMRLDPVTALQTE